MTDLSTWRIKTRWLWLLAVLITLASVAYQRLTGPSYPVRVSYELSDGFRLKCKLPTSQESTSDAPIRIAVSTAVASGQIDWRRLNSHDPWSLMPLRRLSDTLFAELPKQPPAGKLEYAVALRLSSGEEVRLTVEPVTIRFKGHVPPGVLIPHILCMFVAMLLAAVTGLYALAKINDTRRLAFITAMLLFVGGLILGPIVQKYAFGAYWTGWPFGHDLTDNKTALAMLMWLFALWRGRGNRAARGWVITAAIVHFAVYLVPHSMFGSQLDYTAE